MEQFKQIGEVLGGLKALMIFRDEININQKQCILLFDSFNLAFDSISQQMRKHLKFDDKLGNWKPLEPPLRELHRIFRGGELYIKNCLDPKDWWARAILLNKNSDCIESHIHNLLWCVPVVLEAIEAISESSGNDPEEMSKRRIAISKKYDKDWIDPILFEHRFGELYLVSSEMCRRFESAFREDRWMLSEMLSEKKASKAMRELLLGPKETVFPCSVLIGSPGYSVRRRLGGTKTSYKEIRWMGESFAMKHAIGEGEVEELMSEASLHSSLAHPNVMSYLYAFCDEERRECFVVMELMGKDLSSYVREVCGPRKRTIPFPLLVAVDSMLQVARGMEHLHSKNIYHGDLNPSNVLVKAKNSSPDSYLQVKVANFGRSGVTDSCIWYAPEVLTEQEQSGQNSCKRSEKADVYSFGMICFELLTGKVPFEESHLQGEKMSRNIRAGERPLFPFQCPKYLASLIKRCWHSDPMQRPSFGSIARMLRYVKRFLVMSPDVGQGEPLSTPVDYFDIETSLSKRLLDWGSKESVKVWEVPFQMYAYRVIERERSNANFVVKERSSDSGSEGASACGEENGSHGNVSSEDSSSNGGSESGKKGPLAKKSDGKAQKQTGQQQKTKIAKPSQLTTSCRRTILTNCDSHLQHAVISPGGRSTSTSDARLS